jgi:hypothetical protein
MSEKELSKEQWKKIEIIKQKWLDEADAVIKADDQKHKQIRRTSLDGEATSTLAKIQDKYKRQIQEIIHERTLDQ